MGYFLMFALDAFVLLMGFLCVCKPEKLCRGESWKSADDEFEPSELYIESIRHRGFILVGAGLILMIFVIILICQGVANGESLTASEFFEQIMS